MASISDECLTKPLSIEDKWKLIPAYMKVRGLVQQHLDSFNYFLETDIHKILLANQMVTCDSDPNFYLKYTNISIGKPSIEEDMVLTDCTPNECRLRDLTYAAPITVDVEYTRGKQLVVRQNVPIGRLPIMLRSKKCILYECNTAELARLQECPLDPGGYFIVRGVEKAIIIQEQLAKNRILIELDNKKQLCAAVTSSTHERKSRTLLILKGKSIVLSHHSFTDDIPVCIVFKAMGIESDQNIIQLVGYNYLENFIFSIEDCKNNKVFTQQQALDYIGSRIRLLRGQFNRYQTQGKTQIDEAREILYSMIFAHIHLSNYNFFPKCVYIGFMIRRLLAAQIDSNLFDDRDYYGNKRLELAGKSY